MRRKSRIAILFALVLLMLIPGMAAEAKTKPEKDNHHRADI